MARKRRPTQSRGVSALVGGILLSIGFLWVGWILLHGSAPNLSTWTIPGITHPMAASDSDIRIAPLLAEGIVLAHANQKPALSQQQALVTANQLEPAAAAQAKSTSAKYVLLNYSNLSTPGAHPHLLNVPVWMVWYQRIPLEPTGASGDPATSPHSQYDLFVFLDANSGKEVLAVRV